MAKDLFFFSRQVRKDELMGKDYYTTRRRGSIYTSKSKLSFASLASVIAKRLVFPRSYDSDNSRAASLSLIRLNVSIA